MTQLTKLIDGITSELITGFVTIYFIVCKAMLLTPN